MNTGGGEGLYTEEKIRKTILKLFQYATCTVLLLINKALFVLTINRLRLHSLTVLEVTIRTIIIGHNQHNRYGNEECNQ